MNPVIQLTAAVALVVIATRMWPPLLYWLAGMFVLLFTIKGIRRSARWIRKHAFGSGLVATECLLSLLAWVAVAAIADHFHPGRISAVSIVLCIACAILIIGLLLSVAGRLHRR